MVNGRPGAQRPGFLTLFLFGSLKVKNNGLGFCLAPFKKKIQIMITVHKYQFQIADNVVVEMPVGAKLLTIQTQNNLPTIWAMVETGQPMEKRTFRVYGTGHELDIFATDGRYLATIHINGFVWHIFE